MRHIAVIGLVAVVVVTAGCGTIFVGANSLKPNMNSATATEYRIDAPNFAVLGPVTAKVQSSSVVWGIVASGNDGQAVLMQAAQKLYGDKVTGIKDICQTTEFQSVIWGIYTKVVTDYYGVAVSEKK